MSTAVKKIHSEEAVIKTATVEIKSLTLNGKQMTLSVFRQLKNEVLLDPNTGEFRGIPWGIVNYFWGNCGNDHLHVVWQKESELRRSCVFPERAHKTNDLLRLSNIEKTINILRCIWIRKIAIEDKNRISYISEGNFQAQDTVYNVNMFVIDFKGKKYQEIKQSKDCQVLIDLLSFDFTEEIKPREVYVGWNQELKESIYRTEKKMKPKKEQLKTKIT